MCTGGSSGQSGRSVMLTTDFHVMQRLGMHGAIPLPMHALRRALVFFIGNYNSAYRVGTEENQESLYDI
jgi:hypothetical protein